MQPTADLMVGGSNPSWPTMAAAGTTNKTRVRTADMQVCNRLHYHSTAVCPERIASPHCLKPFEHNLLTPPPSKK